MFKYFGNSYNCSFGNFVQTELVLCICSEDANDASDLSKSHL